MKKNYNCQTVKKYVNNCRFKDIFLELEGVYIATYEKGEYVTAPFSNNNVFQVIISGTIEIYYVRDDGTRYSLSSGGEGYIIGDISIFHKNEDNVFAEAKSKVICLSINIDENESLLKNNAAFMYLIAESLANKMQAITKIEASTSTLEERILTYMKYKCQNGEIMGIEQNAFRLHCSSRQLQRIMNKYMDNEIVEKIGKGNYKLKKDIE